MAGLGAPPAYNYVVDLHPYGQAATTVPQLHQPGTRQEQSEEQVIALHRFLANLHVIPEEETAVTGGDARNWFLDRVQNSLEPCLQPTDVASMIREYMDKTAIENWNVRKPNTFRELFQSLLESKKLENLFWIQGLLYKANRVDLCNRVAELAKEAKESRGFRIAHFSQAGEPFRSLHNVSHLRSLGCIQVYVLDDFAEVDLRLTRLRRHLADFLGLNQREICFPAIDLSDSAWITILLPHLAVEVLRKAMPRQDIHNYLVFIGIKKIKFVHNPAVEQAEVTEPESKRAKLEMLSGPSTATEKSAPYWTAQGKTPEWMSWSKGDVIQLFEKKGCKTIAFALQKVNFTGRDMGIWNDSLLEDMGLSEEDVRTVKKEMVKLGVFGSTLDKKVINDPIHGHMEFHPLCIKIIDTPQFQRLRNIKQLGSCYLVYPGASHNRFEHSLGVSHLAGMLVQALQQRQPSLGITEEDVLCVIIAGLCHDLGHGPNSHHFEQFMQEAKKDRKWQHEDASIMMFNHLIKRNNLEREFNKYGLYKNDLQFIREQIQGIRGNRKIYTGRGEDKKFLYEIVANKRNGIDVDKWDYIARDSLMLGVPTSFDHHRFIRHARVIKMKDEWQICSRDKEAEDLYKIFQARYFLSRNAYQHKVHQGVEAMLTDVLLCADKSQAISYLGKDGKRLRISECVDDPVAFSNLDDSVYSLIQLSTAPELKEARDLLEGIRCRRLYKLVCETEPIQGKIKQEILDELLMPPLKSSRVVIREMYLDYGMKEKNPLEEVSFYRKKDPNTAVKISKNQISLFLPERFSEQTVRLYCKDQDETSQDLAARCFKKWCDRNAFHVRA